MPFQLNRREKGQEMMALKLEYMACAREECLDAKNVTYQVKFNFYKLLILVLKLNGRKH